MHSFLPYILTLLIFSQVNVFAQKSPDKDVESGIDITFKNNDGRIISARSWPAGLPSNAQVVLCPKGMRRSSANDVKKKYPYEWTVKYDNIYIEINDGLVVEGMNEYGFSASLMWLKNCKLAKKDKEHIPIAASIAVNFFIDHFKSIDTALLAIWDIRIFDDMEMENNWPFRIVLHDSMGATAYIEYIEGQCRVYTSDLPSCIIAGPDYARLLTIEHLQDSMPGSTAEHLFIQAKEGLSHPETFISGSNCFDVFNSLEKLADDGFLILREHSSGISFFQIIFNKMHVRDHVFFINNLNHLAGEERQKLY